MSRPLPDASGKSGPQGSMGAASDWARAPAGTRRWTWRPAPVRRSVLGRLFRDLLAAMLGLSLGLVLALIPLLRTASDWWDEAIAVALQHERLEVSHPGWSFPARIRTTETPLTRPPKELVIEAKARGYTPNCPTPGRGEFCEKTGAVVPREGDRLEAIELGWLIGPDAEIREHLPLNEAPQVLIDAILAAEDQQFYHHQGVNIVAMVRAALANAKERAFIQGGSTLTMQTVRNLVQSREKTFERKLREMVMAMAIDHELGKERVLQMYLDAPYLGQRGGLSICGFRAASRHYFHKDATELTLAEAATLAAILPAPGRFAPDRAPDLAKERRDRVLKAMAVMSHYDVKDALAEPVTTVPPEPFPERYPSYLSATRAWLESHVEPGVLYGAGLEITVAMDIYMQEVAEKLFPEKTAYLERLVGQPGDTPLQSASVLLDVKTGAMRAVYGGHDVTSTSFNRATQARRQGGSAFKPLVYALAFSQPPLPDGRPRFTAASTAGNSPRVFKTPRGDWQPRNIAGEYTATACLAYGLAWSQNICTASLLEALGGPEKLIEFASNLGFDTSGFPPEMGLALGQGQITPLEMAQFAATVSNGGLKIEGNPVLLAVDASGKQRLGAPVAGPRVLSTEAATLTRELMRLVVEVGTGGRARGGGGESGYQGEVLGKTGTTDKEKDLWFVGATPLYAGALWLGYDVPQSIHASASDLAAPLWGWWMHRTTQFMGEAPTFPKEPKIVRRDVCIITGLNPNTTCPLIAAPFLPGSAPRGICPETHEPPPTPDPEFADESEGPTQHHRREGLWQRWERQQADRRAREEAAASPAPDAGADSPPSQPLENPQENPEQGILWKARPNN